MRNTAAEPVSRLASGITLVTASLLVKDCVAYRRCIRRFCMYVYFSKIKAPGVKFLEEKNFFIGKVWYILVIPTEM